MKKRMTMICMVLLLCWNLCACSPVNTEKGDEIKALCESMIDAILAEDRDAIYAMLPTEGVDSDSMQYFCDNVTAYMEGVESYTLKQIGFQSKITNGKGQYQAVFEMSTNAEPYQVVAVITDDHEGLRSFNISKVSELEAAKGSAYTGTLTTMKGANALQWAILVLSAAVIVFTVLTFIDCYKKPIKRKWLWLLFIALGALIFTVTYENGTVGTRINVGVYPLMYSNLKLAATGAFQLQLVAPLGAIVYCINRRRLLEARSEPAVEMPEKVSAEDNSTDE